MSDVIWTNTSRSATPTYTNQAVSLENATTASAGLYYGFGAFTYSGGQVLSPGTPPVWTTQSIS